MEIFVYNNAPVQDTVSERLQICATRWRDVACFSDEALTDVIEADGVDILVDLSGLTRGHRLGVFARRAAPVQVCWLGWFSTTGLPQFDWYLGDRITLPVAEATAFVERLWRIEGPYYVQSPRQLAIATDAASLDGPVRFGCFNALAKLSMRTLDLWGAILRALPDASLFLRSRELGNRTVCAQLRAEFVRRGVTEEQLVLEPGVPLAEYLGGFSRIDVSLDPSPYTGGATSFDSLWMGVPVLTLAGDRFIAHQGETLLTAVGLTDWIAQDEDDYVRKAIDAAARTGALRQGRCELRQRFMKSPLVDGERLAAQLVAAWQGMARAVVEPLPERPLSDDPQVLEPLAALLLHLSDRSQAIRVLSRLVEVATDPIMRTDAQRRLTLALQEAIP